MVRHDRPLGRSTASNAGAMAATGRIVVFLDGDTLAGPGMVESHLALHDATAGPVIGRGVLSHLRCTRFLSDPETGTPRPEEAARVARMPAAERAASLVTTAQITGDFAAIAQRAQAGVYCGAGPRLLAELEEDALRNHPHCAVLWAAASGSNMSVPRDSFLASGGFLPELDINEHRELAYRLCAGGLRMRLVEGARSYHLTHRSGWRDPLQDRTWERIFAAAHPDCGLPFLLLFWASLSARDLIAPQHRITSLPALALAIAGRAGLDEQATLELLDVTRMAA